VAARTLSLTFILSLSRYRRVTAGAGTR
jgi:hypothetical protein